MLRVTASSAHWSLDRYRLEHNPPVRGSQCSLCDGACLRRPGYRLQPPLGRFSCHPCVCDKWHTFKRQRNHPTLTAEDLLKSVSKATGEVCACPQRGRRGELLSQWLPSAIAFPLHPASPFSGREESNALSLPGDQVWL